MRLHNLCTEHDGGTYLRRSSTIYQDEMEQEAFQEWWRIAENLRTDLDSSRGARCDVEGNDLRQALTQSLKDRGITRTALC